MLHNPDQLLLLAGPCSLENLETCRPVADALKALQEKHSELNILFKGSVMALLDSRLFACL